jgi:hypothetical protein
MTNLSNIVSPTLAPTQLRVHTTSWFRDGYGAHTPGPFKSHNLHAFPSTTPVTMLDVTGSGVIHYLGFLGAQATTGAILKDIDIIIDDVTVCSFSWNGNSAQIQNVVGSHDEREDLTPNAYQSRSRVHDVIHFNRNFSVVATAQSAGGSSLYCLEDYYLT